MSGKKEEKREIFLPSETWGRRETRSGIDFRVVEVFVQPEDENQSGVEPWACLDGKDPLLGLDQNAQEVFMYIPNFLTQEQTQKVFKAIEKFHDRTVASSDFKYDMGMKLSHEGECLCPTGGFGWEPSAFDFRDDLSLLIQKVDSSLPELIPEDQTKKLKDTAKLLPASVRNFWGEHFSLLRLNYNGISSRHLDDHDLPGVPTIVLPFGSFSDDRVEKQRGREGRFEMHNISPLFVNHEGIGVKLLAKPGSAILFHGYRIVHSVENILDDVSRHSLVFSVQKFFAPVHRRREIDLIRAQKARLRDSKLDERIKLKKQLEDAREVWQAKLEGFRRALREANPFVADLESALLSSCFAHVQRGVKEPVGYEAPYILFEPESLRLKKARKEFLSRRKSNSTAWENKDEPELMVELETGETVDLRLDCLCYDCNEKLTQPVTMEENMRQVCAYCPRHNCFKCAKRKTFSYNWRCSMCVSFQKNNMGGVRGFSTFDAEDPVLKEAKCFCGIGGYVLKCAKQPCPAVVHPVCAPIFRWHKSVEWYCETHIKAVSSGKSTGGKKKRKLSKASTKETEMETEDAKEAVAVFVCEDEKIGEGNEGKDAEKVSEAKDKAEGVSEEAEGEKGKNGSEAAEAEEEVEGMGPHPARMTPGLIPFMLLPHTTLTCVLAVPASLLPLSTPLKSFDHKAGLELPFPAFPHIRWTRLPDWKPPGPSGSGPFEPLLVVRRERGGAVSSGGGKGGSAKRKRESTAEAKKNDPSGQSAKEETDHSETSTAAAAAASSSSETSVISSQGSSGDALLVVKRAEALPSLSSSDEWRFFRVLLDLPADLCDTLCDECGLGHFALVRCAGLHCGRVLHPECRGAEAPRAGSEGVGVFCWECESLWRNLHEGLAPLKFSEPSLSLAVDHVLETRSREELLQQRDAKEKEVKDRDEKYRRANSERFLMELAALQTVPLSECDWTEGPLPSCHGKKTRRQSEQTALFPFSKKDLPALPPLPPSCAEHGPYSGPHPSVYPPEGLLPSAQKLLTSSQVALEPHGRGPGQRRKGEEEGPSHSAAEKKRPPSSVSSSRKERVEKRTSSQTSLLRGGSAECEWEERTQLESLDGDSRDRDGSPEATLLGALGICEGGAGQGQQKRTGRPRKDSRVCSEADTASSSTQQHHVRLRLLSRAFPLEASSSVDGASDSAEAGASSLSSCVIG